MKKHDPTMVMPRLMRGICSEKHIVKQFDHCVNIVKCAYTNLDSIAYYMARPHRMAYHHFMGLLQSVID